MDLRPSRPKARILSVLDSELHTGIPIPDKLLKTLGQMQLLATQDEPATPRQQATHNRLVTGSNPVGPTILLKYCFGRHAGGFVVYCRVCDDHRSLASHCPVKSSSFTNGVAKHVFPDDISKGKRPQCKDCVCAIGSLSSFRPPSQSAL
jgi:hypothetical protein